MSQVAGVEGGLRFGLMFFASGVSPDDDAPRYRLLLEAARFADDNGFASVWTPERHFCAFGGIFPSPTVTSAALSTVTTRVRLRAGSLVVPLHDEIRVAEEWAVIDNLSGGRIDISFGAGWNVNDFVFYPERYVRRDAIMYEQIDVIRRLWRGEPVARTNSTGQIVQVSIQPTPIQPSLPVWITAAGNPRTFERAGAIGANVLTHLIGQSHEELRRKIGIYRRARAEHGFADDGEVTLMLHTAVGPDRAAVERRAWTPFREYLRDAAELELKAALGGGTISQGYRMSGEDPIDQDVLDELLDLTCRRYMDGASLIGTPESCRPIAAGFAAMGVTEIACLIDFGMPPAAVLDGLRYLDELRASFARPLSLIS